MRSAEPSRTVGGVGLMCSRILIVDSQPVFRFGLARMLNTEPDLEVVGEAASCRDACPLAATLEPDVVILDLELEDTTGTQAIIRLRERFPKLRAVIFTEIMDRKMVAEALRYDIRGYVLKKSSPDLLFSAARIVAAGGHFLDPAISSTILAELNPAPSDPAKPLLSHRERTILSTLAQGMSNKKIASELFITERTVKFHVSSIMRQLNARNRTHAVMIAEEKGLLTSGSEGKKASSVVPMALGHSVSMAKG